MIIFTAFFLQVLGILLSPLKSLDKDHGKSYSLILLVSVPHSFRKLFNKDPSHLIMVCESWDYGSDFTS